MNTYLKRKSFSVPYRIISGIILCTFLISTIFPPQTGYAQTILNLPTPGNMIALTSAFTPMMIKGVNLYEDNPLKFDFIIDKGDSGLDGETFQKESTRLIKYFMAALTVPEDEMWVNLSPYEKDRIIPDQFGHTEMGRDLLAQDYLLKQLSASLMYPEDELGKKFWKRVHERAYEKFGSIDIPMNTFNKIWIVPKKATVYEHKKGAYVVSSHLSVMLEEDYLALESNQNSTKHGLGKITPNNLNVISGESLAVVREVLIPEIEKEVNEGATFANLRQIYNSMILAVWYKQALKDSILGQIYVDQNKTKGVDVSDPAITQQIYDQYIEAFEKGVYNYIKEDYDPKTQEVIPRKYFSGGALPYTQENVDVTPEAATAIKNTGDNAMVTTKLNPENRNDVVSKALRAKIYESLFPYPENPEIDKLLTHVHNAHNLDQLQNTIQQIIKKMEDDLFNREGISILDERDKSAAFAIYREIKELLPIKDFFASEGLNPDLTDHAMVTSPFMSEQDTSTIIEKYSLLWNDYLAFITRYDYARIYNGAQINMPAPPESLADMLRSQKPNKRFDYLLTASNGFEEQKLRLSSLRMIRLENLQDQNTPNDVIQADVIIQRSIQLYELFDEAIKFVKQLQKQAATKQTKPTKKLKPGPIVPVMSEEETAALIRRYGEIWHRYRNFIMKYDAPAVDDPWAQRTDIVPITETIEQLLRAWSEGYRFQFLLGTKYKGGFLSAQIDRLSKIRQRQTQELEAKNLNKQIEQEAIFQQIDELLDAFKESIEFIGNMRERSSSRLENAPADQAMVSQQELRALSIATSEIVKEVSNLINDLFDQKSQQFLLENFDAIASKYETLDREILLELEFLLTLLNETFISEPQLRLQKVLNALSEVKEANNLQILNDFSNQMGGFFNTQMLETTGLVWSFLRLSQAILIQSQKLVHIGKMLAEMADTKRLGPIQYINVKPVGLAKGKGKEREKSILIVNFQNTKNNITIIVRKAITANYETPYVDILNTLNQTDLNSAISAIIRGRISGNLTEDQEKESIAELLDLKPSHPTVEIIIEGFSRLINHPRNSNNNVQDQAMLTADKLSAVYSEMKGIISEASGLVTHLFDQKSGKFIFEPREAIAQNSTLNEDVLFELKFIMTVLNADTTSSPQMKFKTLKEAIDGLADDTDLSALDKELGNLYETDVPGNTTIAWSFVRLAYAMLSQAKAQISVDQAMMTIDTIADEFSRFRVREKNTVLSNEKGGIDLNPNEMDLQLEGRSPAAMPTPQTFDYLKEMNIEGFTPVIINVTPIVDLPFILGLTDSHDRDTPYAGKKIPKSHPDLILGCLNQLFWHKQEHRVNPV